MGQFMDKLTKKLIWPDMNSYIVNMIIDLPFKLAKDDNHLNISSEVIPWNILYIYLLH